MEGEGGVSLFSDEELKEMSGLKKGDDFVEVMCGCTSHRYGDAVGKLRVFASGDLQIDCECTPGCDEEKLTPAAFEKHSGRETARKWKSNVWVIFKGDKVPLSKTALLKYYNQSANGSHKGVNARPCHRDEFLRCTRCDKDRRFRLRNKEECHIYHDFAANINWKCSDLSTDKHCTCVAWVPEGDGSFIVAHAETYTYMKRARLGLQIVHSQSSRTQLNSPWHMLDRVRALNKREMIDLAQNAAEFVFADDKVKKAVKEICRMLKED